MRLIHLASLAFVILFGIGNLAEAAGIGVVGLFPGKAVLTVNNGSPKTFAVGSNIVDGIKLVDVDESTATIDIAGKRQILVIGDHVSRSATSSSTSITLQADHRGHFVTTAQVNGGMIAMLVDTGATMIALPAADARRLAIDYRQGQQILINTATGRVSGYRIKLNTIKIGDIELSEIDAVVQESGLPFALLGMSFLNRTEMHRDGERMTLTKRF